jgi:hypothetical protein
MPSYIISNNLREYLSFFCPNSCHIYLVGCPYRSELAKVEGADQSDVVLWSCSALWTVFRFNYLIKRQFTVRNESKHLVIP